MNKIIQEILRENFGAKAKVVNQIKGKGEVNQVYIIAANSLKYVIRIDPNESTTDRFQKEGWCMSEVEKLGVCVPKILRIGIKKDHPYMLLSYVKGTPGDEADKVTRVQIWNKLGEYAHKIHAVRVSGCGETMTAPGIFEGSWLDFINYNISSLNEDDRLLTAGFITTQESDALKNIFLKLKNSKFNFGLIHYDLALKNTIIDHHGDVYLLDWGSSEVNVVPHMDINEILYSSLDQNSREFEAFLEGYGMKMNEFERIKPDIFRLQLLTFTDKVRWALDQKPELVKQMVKQLQKALVNIEILLL